MYIYVVVLLFFSQFLFSGPDTHTSVGTRWVNDEAAAVGNAAVSETAVAGLTAGGRRGRSHSPSIAVNLRGSGGAEGEGLVFTRWPEASLCVRGISGLRRAPWCRLPRSRGFKSDPGPRLCGRDRRQENAWPSTS